MIRHTLAAAFAAVVTLAPPAKAAPVSYDINFTNTYTTGSQAATPSGSFTYNPAAATKFSDFKVTIRGVTFDFTAEANGPAPGVGCSAGKSAFDILAGTTGCLSNQIWAYVDGDGLFTSFDLFSSSDPLQANTLFIGFYGNLRGKNPTPLLPGDGPDDGGTFTITARNQPAPAPEPLSIALFGLGLAGLAATRRRNPPRRLNA